MKYEKWFEKDTFQYKGKNFINDNISREKLKKIETIHTNVALKENKEHMTLYASKDGVVTLKHTCIEDAISAINANSGYYRQLWIYDEGKGAYKYATEFKAKDTEI
jgi:arsenate reductase-like glutaredoxin family protein